ncbi:hypothetical protein ACVINI_005775 [Rhizobium beringeri]
MPGTVTARTGTPSPILAKFEDALAKLSDGYVDGHFGNRPWGVTVKRSQDGKRTWLYGEELRLAEAISSASTAIVWLDLGRH